MNNITFGNTSGSNLYLHGDFGGQFDDEGTFGYRINVVTQDGDTHVEHQNLQRDSIALVLDWQVNDDLLIEVSGSKRDSQLKGRQPYWWIDDTKGRPAAKDIDPNKLWAPKWNEHSHNSHRLGTRVHWDLTENISWRSAYETNETESYTYFTGNTFQSLTSFNQKVGNRGIWIVGGSGGFSYLDISFNTGGIAHTLTTGFRFSKSYGKDTEKWRVGTMHKADLSLTDPSYFSEPDWGNPDLGRLIDEDKLASHNFIIGDDIKFNEQWSALLGVSLVEVSVSERRDDDYKKTAVTPNLSLIYQPVDNITTYVSYSEGLEIGGIAKKSYQSVDKDNVINAGEVMDPLMSHQFELGAKVDVNGMLLTAALFEIDKALEYYQEVDDAQFKFVQDGRQVHRGLEFTATGKLTENLSVVGGFTLLDSQIKDNKENPELVGKRETRAAKQLFKLYGEYNITAIPGLVINGGFNHNGSFYGDDLNTDKIDAYTLVDIGARYNLEVAAKDVTFRLNINNVTDEQYWVQESNLGDRRTVSLSASVEF